MSFKLRLLTAVFAFTACLYLLSPFLVLAQEVFAQRLPVDVRYTVDVGSRGPVVRIALTYLSSVPIRYYTFKFEPRCGSCAPKIATGELLAKGDTISLEIELVEKPESALVEFEGLLAGLYRFRVSMLLPAGSGG